MEKFINVSFYSNHMGIVQRMFGGSEIECSHPLDVMHRINPELASLAYADKENLLSSRILPYMALHRRLQSNEKIALIEGMARKYGYDAQIAVNRDSESGATDRVRLREDGMTQRAGIEGKTLVDLQKLKYEANRAIINAHVDGQKYLSDNEVKALSIEANAYVESVRLHETLQAETARQLSKDKLEAMVTESEMKYAALIRQAEEVRGMQADANRRDISTAYIREQAEINRALINAGVEGMRIQGEVKKTYYKTMGELGKGGIELLGKTGKRKFSFRGKGELGDLNFDIDVE